MKVETWACDNCGKQKQEANHWLLLYQAKQAQGTVAAITKFRPDVGEGFFHACGQECAFAMLTRWIATGSFERKGSV